MTVLVSITKLGNYSKLVVKKKQKLNKTFFKNFNFSKHKTNKVGVNVCNV